MRVGDPEVVELALGVLEGRRQPLGARGRGRRS